MEEAGEGLEEMIHLTNDWGGQMVGGEREALESGGMIGHGGEGERSGVGQEDDLQEFGELDEFLGLR